MGMKLVFRKPLVPAILAALTLCVVAAAEARAPVVPKGVDLSKPLTLAQAVKVGLANSTQMPIATNSAVKSKAQAVQARSQWLPNLTLSWRGNVTRSVAAGTLAFGVSAYQDTTRTLQLILSQTFFQSGLRDQIRAAYASAEASRDSMADTHRTLVLNIATDYYTALADQELVAVAQRAQTASQSHLDAANARITAGTAARSDRYPFEVELAQAKLLVVSYQTQAGVDLSNLKAILGLPADMKIQLADTLARPDLPTDLPDLVRQAYLKRPDLQAQEALVRSARLLVSVARASRGPILNANGQLGYGNFTGNDGTEWQLSVGVTMPVFDSGASGSRVTAAKADLSTAEQTLRQLQIDVGSEIEREYLTAAKSRAAIDEAETAVGSARISRDAAEGKYQEGVGSYIDVTDAENQLVQAESGYVQSLYTYNTALAALKASLVLPPAPGL